MKFTINTQTLLTQIAILAGVIPTKNTLPALENILIESTSETSLRLSGTDLDVTLSCTAEAAISEPGQVIVNMAKLLAITKTLPKTADMAFQSIDDGGANLTCERARFKLLGIERNQYVDILKPKKGAINIPASVFTAMIEATLHAITLEESRYTLSGAKLEIDKTSMRMITTDGHRLSKAENTEITSDTPVDVIIPRKALAQLARICEANSAETVSFTSDTNHIYFEIGDHALSARLLTGQFPNYDMVIPKSNGNSFTTDISLFREALKRVALMSDERSHSIRLDIKAGQLHFNASTAEHGEAIETIPIEFDGEETSIGFNSQYLLDSYNSLGSNQKLAKLSFKDANAQILVEPGMPIPNQTVTLVIMPCRL